MTEKFINRSGIPSVCLVVGCDADRAFGMVCSVVMVVKGFYQRGKQEKDYKKK